MRSAHKFSIAITTAFLTSLCATAQTPDPYNPQTRRILSANTTVEPTLADMGSGTDQGNIGPFVTMTDKQYAQAMAARGIMEIRLGQVAMDKSSSDAVKGIAQRMIKDYLNWNDGMRKAALKLSITLPTDLDAKQKATLEHISGLSGDSFDRAYLTEVIHLQQKALTMSHHEADEASVTGFRHWAGITIPTIQDQIETAQRALEAKTTISRK
jgi:putative membrane protein